VKRLLTCVLALFPVLLLAAGPGSGPHTLLTTKDKVATYKTAPAPGAQIQRNIPRNLNAVLVAL